MKNITRQFIMLIILNCAGIGFCQAQLHIGARAGIVHGEYNYINNGDDITKKGVGFSAGGCFKYKFYNRHQFTSELSFVAVGTINSQNNSGGIFQGDHEFAYLFSLPISYGYRFYNNLWLDLGIINSFLLESDVNIERADKYKYYFGVKGGLSYEFRKYIVPYVSLNNLGFLQNYPDDVYWEFEYWELGIRWYFLR